MDIVLGSRRVRFAELETDPDFRRFPDSVIALGEELPEPGAAFAFQDWAAFKRFVKGTPIAESIAGLDERRRKTLERGDQNVEAAIARRRLVAERIDSDLRELSERTGFPWGSKELFIQATGEADPIEGSIFDPAMLYTSANFTGSALAVVASLGAPDLGWFPGMDNAVTSIQVSGVLALYSRRWYGGSSRVFVGLPYFQVANLGSIGFNNIASSALLG